MKDKRHVLRSIIDRLHDRYHVSVAEVEDNDLWQRATLAIAAVSNSHPHADSVLASAMKEITARHDAEVMDHHLEWL